MILDHFGFTSVDDPSAFDQLLQLAQYPNVFVKVSALFRLGDENGESYRRVRKERFLPLLEAFGADRLMYGSDFPFVLDQPQAYEMHKLVASWIDDSDKRAAVMGGTAERVFGPWGNVPKQSSS
jgi:predicted TIM-barrel fold metal-dependent hydrolase